MTDPDNIVLVYLRRIDEKVDRLIEDVQNVKVRMTNVEREFGEVKVAMAETNHRIDRLEVRVERIEKRLDLHDNSFMEAQKKFEDS